MDPRGWAHSMVRTEQIPDIWTGRSALFHCALSGGYFLQTFGGGLRFSILALFPGSKETTMAPTNPGYYSQFPVPYSLLLSNHFSRRRPLPLLALGHAAVSQCTLPGIQSLG